MNAANQVGLREVEFVVAAVDENALGVQQGTHGAVAKTAPFCNREMRSMRSVVMDMVEAEAIGLIELYRKPREFAIVRTPKGSLALCYNSADSNISSQFIMMSGVNV